MAKEYSQSIAMKINSFLVEDDWKFSFDQEEGVFQFDLNVGAKVKTLSFRVRVRKTSFTVFVFIPFNADNENAEEMAKISEFIARANYGLLRGTFEMDYSDGECRYRYFVDCEGIEPSKEMIESSIYSSASLCKQYGEGFASIIFGNSSALDAVNKCEAD